MNRKSIYVVHTLSFFTLSMLILDGSVDAHKYLARNGKEQMNKNGNLTFFPSHVVFELKYVTKKKKIEEKACKKNH